MNIIKIALTSTLVLLSATLYGGYKYANFSNNVAEAKEAGYDGIQVNSFRGKQEDTSVFPESEIKRLKSQLKKHNMQICSVCTPCYHKFLFEEDKNVIPYMKSVIDFTAEVGADNILVPFFGKSSLYQKNSRKLRTERLEPLVKLIKEVAKYAATKNVVIALETTLNSTDHIKILDMINEPNVKVYFDTLNIVYAGEQPEVAIKNLGKDRIAQIHIKANAEYFEEAKQPMNFDKCFQTIVDSGYDGWLVLEQGTKRKVHTNMEIITHNLKFFKSSVLEKK